MGGEGPAVEDVMKALKRCYDPEIPVNIVDLGLIYDVKVEDGSVYVKMTMTARGCPMHRLLSENVRREVEKLHGVKQAVVEVVWDPPWTPDRISKQAREELRL